MSHTLGSSDGPQPHFITIEFPRKVAIQVSIGGTMFCQYSHGLWDCSKKLSIYLCFPLDDSYTPATLAVRAGTGPLDLQDCRVVSLEKPDGWFTFDVSMEPLGEEGEGL